jgi:hypothetical protein
MNLTGIISIAGKPGLYRVVAQGNNNVIVESLEDNKRFPAHSNNRISALDDISIYTYEEDVPLKEVFDAIYKKENGGAAISHKENQNKLAAYMAEVLPNYDQERVYASDVKKLFQWYNLLHKAGALVMDEEKEVEEKSAEEKPKKETAEKKSTAKKPAAKKPAAKGSAAGAKAEAKKPTTKKAPVKKATGAKKNG